MQSRAFVRAVPRSPMTVAFEDRGESFAYGAVANISEGGACVWTAARFGVGQMLDVHLSAASQPQPLAGPAVVVWGKDEASRERQTHRYGLRWVDPTPAYKGHIRSLLSLPI